MTTFTRRAIILAALMLSAFVLSAALTPTKRIVPGAARFDLESVIPLQFGDWQTDKSIIPVVNPQTKEYLGQIYSQTLSRTYINSAGRRIMMSLAYGENQIHDNQVHKPEVCYPAQGFLLLSKNNDTVQAGALSIPVMRVVAQLGERHEPVTYWIRMGESLVRGAIEQNFARIRYGLKGYIPDGILFRISEINTDTADSFALQDQFIQALLPSLTPAAREVLIGPTKIGTEQK